MKATAGEVLFDLRHPDLFWGDQPENLRESFEISACNLLAAVVELQDEMVKAGVTPEHFKGSPGEVAP